MRFSRQNDKNYFEFSHTISAKDLVDKMTENILNFHTHRMAENYFEFSYTISYN